MRVEVMRYYSLTNPLTQAGYYETDTHKQLTKDIKAAILEGRLIALCGVVGCGKTVGDKTPYAIAGTAAHNACSGSRLPHRGASCHSGAG